MCADGEGLIMSRRRYVSTNISTDAKVNRLISEHGPYAGLLYTWMVPHAEDDGSLTADPEEILYTVMPGQQRQVSSEQVAEYISAMVELGLLEPDGERLRFPESDFRRFKAGNASPERRAWEKVARFLRPLILERDGYRCVLCGSGGPLEVDHRTPLARGGSNDETNLQTLCRPCNRRKWAN